MGSGSALRKPKEKMKQAVIYSISWLNGNTTCTTHGDYAVDERR
jgi:hypothetical protein